MTSLPMMQAAKLLTEACTATMAVVWPTPVGLYVSSRRSSNTYEKKQRPSENDDS